MALQINQQKTLNGGITINSIYCRLAYSVNDANTLVTANVNFYATKAAFKNNLGRLSLSHEPHYNIEYNAAIDTDLVLKVHEEVKKALTLELTREVNEYAKETIYEYNEDGTLKTEDEKPVIKFNQGELIATNTEVEKAAFCLPENIEIVDL